MTTFLHFSFITPVKLSEPVPPRRIPKLTFPMRIIGNVEFFPPPREDQLRSAHHHVGATSKLQQLAHVFFFFFAFVASERDKWLTSLVYNWNLTRGSRGASEVVTGALCAAGPRHKGKIYLLSLSARGLNSAESHR